MSFADRILDWLRFAWYELGLLSPVELLLTFWPCFFVDAPWYTLSDVAVFLRARFPRRVHLDFERRLEADPPLVTVLVPARNEEETIRATLESLLDNDYPNVELICVDDGSDDATFGIAKRVAARDPRVRVMRQFPRGGKSSALNRALTVARGEFVVVTDSDTAFDRDAIREIIRPFGNPRVGCVSGDLRVLNRDESLCTRLQACEYLQGITIGRQWLSMIGFLAICSGAFGAFRRELITDVGGWDVGPGEDSDTTLRIRKLGYLAVFEPRAVAFTKVPRTFRRLFKQRLRWNRNYVRRLRKHGNVFRPGLFDSLTFGAYAVGFVYKVVLLVTTLAYLVFLFFNWHSIAPMVLLFVLGFYGVTNFLSLFFACVLSRHRREDLKLLGYFPLMKPYHVFLKYNRAVAYLTEFFRIDRPDPYVPLAVWRQIPRW